MPVLSRVPLETVCKAIGWIRHLGRQRKPTVGSDARLMSRSGTPGDLPCRAERRGPSSECVRLKPSGEWRPLLHGSCTQRRASPAGPRIAWPRGWAPGGATAGEPAQSVWATQRSMRWPNRWSLSRSSPPISWHSLRGQAVAGAVGALAAPCRRCARLPPQGRRDQCDRALRPTRPVVHAVTRRRGMP